MFRAIEIDFKRDDQKLSGVCACDMNDTVSVGSEMFLRLAKTLGKISLQCLYN